MMANHQILEWVRTTDDFRIARAIRQDDRRLVLLKTSGRECPTPAQVTRLRREHELLRSLNIPTLPRATEFFSDPDPVIVFDDFPGQPLDVFLQQHRPNPSRCLRIALDLAQTLAQLHSAGIIHGSLQPASLLIAPAQHGNHDRLCLVDISRAMRTGEPSCYAHDVLQGELDYLAPEQTGRMNRAIDHRVDLYSLGAVLYHLLIGKAPFHGEDVLEWVHRHVACVPRPPSKIDAGVPQPVSDVTMKLLSKDPEQRYQSTTGLISDLQRCLAQLERNQDVDGFVLDEGATPIKTKPIDASSAPISDRLDALVAVKSAHATSVHHTLPTLLDTLMRVVLEHSGAQTAALVFVHGPTLTPGADASVHECDINVRVHDRSAIAPSPLPLSFLDHVRDLRKPVILPDAAQPQAFTDNYFTAHRPKSVLGLPILRESNVIGLLYLEHNLVADIFGPERLPMLTLLGSQAIMALENAQLSTNLQYDDERFHYLALAIHDAIYDWNVDTGEVWRNDAYRKLFGNGEPLDSDDGWWLERLHPDDHDRVMENLQQAFREHNRLWQEEYHLRRADGSYAAVLDRAYILYGPEGQPERMVGAVSDITERKQEKAALQEREQRIRRLMESNLIGIFSWNLDGTVTDANEAFLKIIGYTRNDMREGKINWREMTPPEYSVATANAIHEIRTKGQCTPYEKEYFRKDGTRAPVFLGSTLLEGSSDKGVSFVLDLTERKRAEDRIRYMAQHDSLTGLPNRLLLNDRVSLAIAQAHRQGQLVAMLFIDLDHFKHINDSLGHQVGDRLLRAAARRLQRCLREGDSVARLGGDEFVISLAGISETQDAALVAQKALAALNRPFVIDGNELHVTGSIGISLYPDDGKDTDALMRAADIAMYHAKESGRNNYQFFTPNLNEVAKWRLDMANRLHQALERNEFVLHYQPQIDLSTGKIVAAEALIRWHKPDAELVSCGEFLGVAEETGLILSIGEWALRQACRQVKRWRKSGYPDLRVAVNLSPRQFRQPRFFEQVAKILEECGLPGNALELEITENVLMLQDADNILTLERLFVLGVQLSVDDFGIGYSSLTYLQRFPVHALKIDRSFMHGIGQDPNDTAIVNAVIAMGTSLHLRVIAEGVENKEQLEFLRNHHCTAVQGYYFSEAVAADRFVQILHDANRLKRYAN